VTDTALCDSAARQK